MQLLRAPLRKHCLDAWYRLFAPVLRLAALLWLLAPPSDGAASTAPSGDGVTSAVPAQEGRAAPLGSGTTSLPTHAPTGLEVPPGPAEPDLVRVAFPLTSEAPTQWEAPRRNQGPRDRLAYLGMLELRDPFALDDRRIARLPRVPVLVPDLKDPFAPGARPVPLNWQRPQVPSDIRDPFDGGGQRFAGPLPAGCASDDVPRTTANGVVIQRPRALQSARVKEDRRRCRVPRPPIDLRDPFQRR